MNEHTKKLATALGLRGGDLDFLAPLDAAASRQLLTDIERASGKHAGEIKQRMEQALSHIPFLLRGPIRKLFGI